MLPRYFVASDITSLTHELHPGAFAYFEERQSPFRALNVSSNCFCFAYCHLGEGEVEFEKFAPVAYQFSSRFLMALNLAARGDFVWSALTQQPGIFTFNDSVKQVGYPLSTSSENHPDPLRGRLEDSDVREALGLTSIIMLNPDLELEREYLKGLFHLGMRFQDLSFRKEAFFNFYRVVEHYVAQKVLKKDNIGKELKAVKAAFELLGVPDKGFEIFHKMYVVRGDQVGHAQRPQSDIRYDDTLIMKLVADMLLRVHYRAMAPESAGKLERLENNLAPSYG